MTGDLFGDVKPATRAEKRRARVNALKNQEMRALHQWLRETGRSMQEVVRHIEANLSVHGLPCAIGIDEFAGPPTTMGWLLRCRALQSLSCDKALRAANMVEGAA